MTSTSSKPVDLIKLSKVLARTQSTFDSEVLTAAKFAARMVTEGQTSYEDLILGDGGKSKQHVVDRSATREEVFQLRREIETLKMQLAKAEQGGKDGLLNIRTRLLSNAPLLTWERESLKDLTDIPPRSRAEYFVLWLARRYLKLRTA